MKQAINIPDIKEIGTIQNLLFLMCMLNAAYREDVVYSKYFVIDEKGVSLMKNFGTTHSAVKIAEIGYGQFDDSFLKELEGLYQQYLGE